MGRAPGLSKSGRGPRAGGKANRAPAPLGKPGRTPARTEKTERAQPARAKGERAPSPGGRGLGAPAAAGREDRASSLGGWLYGRNAVLEALRSGGRVKRVLIARTAHGEPIRHVVEEAERRGISVEFAPRERLDAATPHHQGVLAEVRPFQYTPFERLLQQLEEAQQPPLLLALDGIQDPQNLGALIRTAAAVGALGVVLPERRAAGVTPAVVKASAGTAARIAVSQVTNLARAIEVLKERGLWVVGLAADGDQLPWETDLKAPTLVVVGAEGAGLGRLIRQHCDLTVRLPMPGQIDSLNASVAGAVLLYEVVRQRGEHAAI